MRVNDCGMLVPRARIFGIMDVLSGSEKKGLEHREAELRCEDRPHSGFIIQTQLKDGFPPWRYGQLLQ